MRRRIARSERMYVSEIRTQALQICVVRGGVDAQLLDAAFTAVLAEAPGLRSRLEKDGDDFYLTPLAPDELPRLHVRRNEPGARLEEYNKPLHLGGPLARAVLLTGSDEDVVLFGVDHAISDGRSATSFTRRIWQRYIDIQEGSYAAPDTASQEYPKPLDEWLPARTDAELDAYVQERIKRAEGAPVASLPFSAAGSTPPVPPEQLMTSRRLRLTEQETSGLLAFAKDAGVSVNGLVAAALLAAVRAGLPADLADHRLSSFCTVDLRDQVAPGLSHETMVPMVSWYRDLLDVPEGADLVKVGHRFTTELRGAMDRGDAALEMQALDRLLVHPQLWPTSLVLTNVGRIDGPPSPKGLEIVDMTKFPLSSRWDPARGSGPLLASPATIYNRFSIEMPYSTQCFSAEQMDSIHDHIRESLLGFAERAPR
ncbi:condensation domain-containing protein [Amycolatopsis sp. OK19-0408]|uniref:Phthiocerol/phthiodiolone dimycocerosyl transferase n=1 Tax=Amycolatopsis iheyensis TaxID=2945988 RepID=A0A9X2NJ32_9PSEU|nr:condensation domain-containing protein [Amycolatopsis iheyensis]MCR6488757.1 condensation domain-containing protein [Amycolatopsis iheyensis]